VQPARHMISECHYRGGTFRADDARIPKLKS